MFFPSFLGFVGWLILVYLGFEGLGVFVFLFLLFFLFCCWIVVMLLFFVCFYLFLFS